MRKFGKKYEDRFRKRFEKIEAEHLRLNRYSVKASYGSLLVARHQFARLPMKELFRQTASYPEIKKGYESGKKIMTCLSTCMRY